MLQLMNEIPDLRDSVCEALIIQEYWCHGEKSEGVNLLFLKVKDGGGTASSLTVVSSFGRMWTGQMSGTLCQPMSFSIHRSRLGSSMA